METAEQGAEALAAGPAHAEHDPAADLIDRVPGDEPDRPAADPALPDVLHRGLQRLLAGLRVGLFGVKGKCR